MDPYDLPVRRGGSDSLADVLERVLDKGLVIAGDIRINLLDIELLTIRIRLLVASAEKAEELGMAWWRNDPFFTGAHSNGSRGELDQRLGRIEQALGIEDGSEALEAPTHDEDGEVPAARDRDAETAAAHEPADA